MVKLVWDKKTQFVFYQLEESKFNILQERYMDFRKDINDPKTEPISVFKPLDKKRAEELELIREVSRHLQKKKQDDINKAKADAEAAEEAAKNLKEEESKEKENTTNDNAEVEEKKESQ